MGSSRSSFGRLYANAYGIPDRTLRGPAVYAVCVVWIAGTDAEIEQEFDTARAALGLAHGYEFHARRLTKREQKEQLASRVFQQMDAQALEYRAQCVLVDKAHTRLPPAFSGKMLMHEVMARTLSAMPHEMVARQTLAYDDVASGKKASRAAVELRNAINRRLHAEGKEYSLSRVILKPAHQCAGIHLADMLAAAVAVPWSDCLKLVGDRLRVMRA